MKKILLVLSMFLFMTNVKALTFNVNLTNIEDKGNNGTIGSITNIDISNKTIDTLFQNIGDEVSFDITITNSGNRVGTLRSITVTSQNDKISYTNNLPSNGLAINGNDTNMVTITAKVLQGATNGTSSSTIKITYNYDEGSCPDGEILSDDESMCLCPEGLERGDSGVCVKPEQETVSCEDDEVYNETKKICEKKTTPSNIINPSNPKTMDNIILITLLFFVSGLGIYAVLYKKLQTKKKKITVGVITGVITLGASFTVLAGIFGLDNLLSAIVNPITKSKEIVLTVNEEIDLIETWDGECSLEVSDLTAENIFEGGTGTESDPYQIKTAEQLSCLAKSVNNGTTYEGQYIKQIKNIKLNDKVNDNVDEGTTEGLNSWTPIGYYVYDDDSQIAEMKNFSGTYDGDNYVISGLYITDASIGDYKALFGCEVYGTFKNMILSDVCFNTTGYAAALVGIGYCDTKIDNVKTYGKAISALGSAGILEYFLSSGPKDPGVLDIENTENNIDFPNINNTVGGIVASVIINNNSDEPNLVLKNVTNNGYIRVASTTGGIIGVAPIPFANALFDNVVNNGNFENPDGTSGNIGGLVGYFQPSTGEIKNSYNTGNFIKHPSNTIGSWGGLIGNTGSAITNLTIDNSYNSGNITYNSTINGQMVGLEINLEGMTQSQYEALDLYDNDNTGGLVGNNYGNLLIKNSYNTGNITTVGSATGGFVGYDSAAYLNIEDSYNAGNITASGAVAGLVGRGGLGVTRCYNTGTIIQFASNSFLAGLVGDRSRNAGDVSYSYNEGEIINKSKVKSPYSAGLCGQCNYIRNSYNKGNVTNTYGFGYTSGIIFNTTASDAIIENTYNAGKITALNKNYGPTDSGSPYVSGIGNVTQADYVNVYNLGELVYEFNYGAPATATSSDSIYIGGITTVSGKSFDNCVNAGAIKLVVKNPFTFKTYINLSGINNYAGGPVTNSFNAGTITLDDSALDTPIAQDGLEHSLSIGEIKTSYGLNCSGNKFNTSSSNYALGQYPTYATLEQSQEVGTYTRESTPSILSVINGDNAFEILEGEELPTLKVFNN